MAFILTVDQQVSLAVAFQDSHGNPATVDGVPAWASSDDTLFALQAADDGMSAVVAAVGTIGAGQISVTADADLGAGTVQIIGTLDMQIVGGQAVSAVITPGSAEDKVQVNPLTP